ncbi:MAG TPA: BrnT family toxin [Desulfuromonadales bacterium]|nr:BrnT family toxin [Desulfuromonadales bacterium]
MTYEWDKRKEISNIKRHGVSFHEASTVFLNPLSMSFYDPDHSDDEDRFITLGFATTGKLLFISHTDRGTVTRIISAREATKKECEGYEKANR